MTLHDDPLNRKLKARSAIWKSLTAGLLRLIDEVPSKWNGPDSLSYRQEKELILKHVEPVYSGLTIAGLLFVTFRVTGSRWYLNNILRRGSKPKSSTLPTAGRDGAWKSHLDKQTDEARASMKNVGGLLYDLALSLVCGASSCLLLMKPQVMREELPLVPLVSGKSLVFETICPEITRAYDSLDEELGDGLNIEDETIQAFLEAYKNCNLRSEFISQQRDAAVETPEFVPYPGLKLANR